MAEYRYSSALGEVPPTMVDGPPPVDQTALVASLQAQVLTLQNQVNDLVGLVQNMKTVAQSCAGLATAKGY